MADMHLPIRPGTDTILADAMLKIIMDEGLIDESFIQARTNGYDELSVYLNCLDLSQVAGICGLELGQIREAALAYGEADTGMVLTAEGEADGWPSCGSPFSKPGLGYR